MDTRGGFWIDILMIFGFGYRVFSDRVSTDTRILTPNFNKLSITFCALGAWKWNISFQQFSTHEVATTLSLIKILNPPSPHQSSTPKQFCQSSPSKKLISLNKTFLYTLLSLILLFIDFNYLLLFLQNECRNASVTLNRGWRE